MADFKLKLDFSLHTESDDESPEERAALMEYVKDALRDAGIAYTIHKIEIVGP